MISLGEQIEKQEQKTDALINSIIDKCNLKGSKKDLCLFKELINLSNPHDPFLSLSPYKRV